MKNLSFKQFTKNYNQTLKSAIDSIDLDQMEKAVKILTKAHKSKKYVFACGNGGSASTATHIAADLAKTIKGHKGDSEWEGFRTISLSDNISTITAWSNDVHYECIYAEQIKTLANKNDVLIAISSSGNSNNILNAVEQAKEQGLKIISVAGFGGGKLGKIGDANLICESKEYGPVEDLQMIINHILVNWFFYSFSQNSKSAV